MTDKSQEYGEKVDAVKSDLRSQIMGARKKFESDHPDANKALLYDIVSGKYGKALSKAKAGYVDMDPFERMDYDMENRGFQTGGLIGYQNGGGVQDDAMMKQFLQRQQMMEQPNSFVPFEQRPPGAAASGSWGEPGAYMKSLRATRDSLDREDSMMVHQRGRNFLNKMAIDSILKENSGELLDSPRPKYLYDGLGLEGSTPSMGEPPSLRDLNEYFNSQLMQGRDSAAIEQGRQNKKLFPRY